MKQYKFEIDPVQGMVFCISPTGKVMRRAGKTTVAGYRYIQSYTLKGLEHRIIWEHVNGQIPEGLCIDHINGVKQDNRITNLRLVTHGQNSQNQHDAHKDNLSTGHKGVYKTKHDRYRVQIGVNKRLIYVGTFETLNDAVNAYKNAATIHHTHNPSVE